MVRSSSIWSLMCISVSTSSVASIVKEMLVSIPRTAAVIAIGHASGNENISFDPLFMIHNDVIGHLIRHFSMENHYKLS